MLFPPLLLFFFAAVALGLAALLALLLGRAAGLLFFALALACYLAYEVLHLLAHWPQQGVLARSALLRRLLEHHRLHHAPALMARGNFNIIDDVTTLHGVLLPRSATWPSVASLVYDGQWSSEVQFEWWRPGIVLAFLDSFTTIDTPWYEVLWVKYVFIDTTFGAVAGEFLFDLL